MMKGYVLASKYLVDAHMLVGYMYREEASGADSGWRFFVGSESEDYIADTKHIGIYDINTILELDASIKPYLDAEPGVSFTRVAGTNRFETERLLDGESLAEFGYVFATKMLVDNKLPVKFMYRETPEKNDSGWRFFCGLEDQAYVDDPDNIVIIDLRTILEIDADVKSYLNSEPGCAYEREEASDPFRLVEDFDFAPEDE